MSDEYRPFLSVPAETDRGRIYSENGRIICDPPDVLAWVRCRCGAPVERANDAEIRCADANCGQIVMTAVGA